MNSYKTIEKIIKEYPMEKVEETYKKDIEHNKILYKIIYHQLTVGQSIETIKTLYGEIGILILMKILKDNNLPIPKDLEKEFYFNTKFTQEIKTEEKALDEVYKLFLIIGVTSLIIKNFF